jgi:hypothetical protein
VGQKPQVEHASHCANLLLSSWMRRPPCPMRSPVMALTLALREAVAGVFLSLEAGYVGILRPSGWQTGAARYGFFSVFFRVQNHDDDKIHFDPRSPKLLHSTCSLSWRDAGGGLVVRNLIDVHFSPRRLSTNSNRGVLSSSNS